MKRSHVGRLGGVLSTAIAAAVAPAAGAATVTISQRIDLNQVLATGGSVNGLFDISSLLAAPPGSTVNVTSASVTGYAFSDAVPQSSNYTSPYQATGSFIAYYYTYSYTYYVSYSCGWFSTCYRPITYYTTQPVYGTEYDRTSTTTNSDAVVDELQVTIGGDTISDAVGLTQSDTGYGTRNLVGSYTTERYYQRDRTITSLNYGDIDLNGSLGAAALFALSTTQQLSYSALQLVGRSNLRWIQLDAVVDITSVPVPLPASGLLLGGALSLLGVGARVRRKKVAV